MADVRSREAERHATISPTQPSHSDVVAGHPWIDTADTTNPQLYLYTGSVFVLVGQRVESKSFFIETVVAADDFAFYRTYSAITLIETDYLCIGGTNWVGQVQEGDANGINGVDTQSADTTATAGTNGQVTSYSNAAIDAGDYLILKTTSISGTPTYLVVTVYYTID